MEDLGPAAMERLRTNLDAVLERLRAAQSRSGRPEGSTTLVAVTKSQGPPAVRALHSLGVRDFGENRPEEVPFKSAAAGALPDARWHMIGHYQGRKVRPTLGAFSWVHSVHGATLIERLAAECARLGRSPRLLLQINVANEASKQGFDADELPAALESLERFPALDVQGLMTMAPHGLDSGSLRRLFARLRGIRDRHASAARPLPHLSMGMSGDFEEAVLEGATLVRIGSALFDGLDPAP